MEEEIRDIKVSQVGPGEQGAAGRSSKERTNLDCYEQCMNDSMDINSDAFCASVCGF